MPELLSPAGNWDCLRAAVANGADAVYFGLPRFNARMRADNFSDEDLPEVTDFCHRHGVRAYLVLNVLVFTDELGEAETAIRAANQAGIDALIVQDMGVVRLARQIAPDLPIHASTQMTITSPEGARFAADLGVERIVLARELSLREIERFQINGDLPPVEVFVHGALCVAYSGQCLTSESLGKRSANRGECAQACRMPYTLVVDGETRPLGDRNYLLSPQDLSAVAEIPALIERGVVSFKIEGRLKTPDYVAAVTRVYREAIDKALDNTACQLTEADRYRLEMAFSRGLYSGWMHGVNHQELVHGRFGKKRGAPLGTVTAAGRDFVELDTVPPHLKPGDGVVFENPSDTDHECGGRVFAIHGSRVQFGRSLVDLRGVRTGSAAWKTDDPALKAELERTWSGQIPITRKRPVDATVSGVSGGPLALTLRCGDATTSVSSSVLLDHARNRPLTPETVRAQLSKFGEVPFALSHLEFQLDGPLILPLAEINRLRREAATELWAQLAPRRRENHAPWTALLSACKNAPSTPGDAQLSVLCRSMEQAEAASRSKATRIYLDFEDVRRYADAVAHLRLLSSIPVYLATPRIQKSGEQGFFRLIQNANPKGVLVRNLGGISFLRDSGLSLVGDFSLNVSNPLSADWLIRQGLEFLTLSYDLNIDQVLALLRSAPPGWFEITLHQHMPMFHMEHCVFAAFLSEGKDYTDCGRPCDSHRVHLRDRIGMEHPLRADVGCRNTLFNAVAQTGASHFSSLRAAGLLRYRVELLEESAAQTDKILHSYDDLLSGTIAGNALHATLQAANRLGVTEGTLATL